MKIHYSLVRLGGLAAILSVCASASAEPEFLEMVKAKYKAGSCQSCHSTPPDLNPYGKALLSEMEKVGVETPTNNIFARLDDKDSDADGVSNKDELLDGMSPGEPNTVTMKGRVGHIEDRVPKHAFHPLIAHFPIGLYLFGVFLEVIASIRKDASLKRLAMWNLGFGALGAGLTVATGFASFLMRGFAFEGTPGLHLVFGSLACLSMAGSVVLKLKKPNMIGLYWFILALATACTMIGGHLGATMVYG